MPVCYLVRSYLWQKSALTFKWRLHCRLFAQNTKLASGAYADLNVETEWDRLQQRALYEGRDLRHVSHSRRKSKRLRGSPSRTLVEVFQARAAHIDIPSPKHLKNDLSYVNAFDRRRSRKHRPQDEQIKKLEDQTLRELRLQHLLALYTSRLHERLSEPGFEDQRGSLHQDLAQELVEAPKYSRANEYLAERSYSWQDVQTWQTILSTRDDALAAKELLINNTTYKDGRIFPIPVLLMFLRRERLSAATVHILLQCAFTLFRPAAQNSPSGEHGQRQRPIFLGTIDHSSAFILIVRLLRHARQVLPSALISISKLFMMLPTFEADSPSLSYRKRTTRRARIALLYNRILQLLSIPPSAHPYHSVSFMQRAQFDIIAFMAGHEPPIPMNREGFRAVSQVQLANRKTVREQDWASLKARSWPPWKQDRLGFDADKGPEYGVSQALEAIHKAREAGYGSGRWEAVASVLSGFENDRSPTIQTRAYFLHQRIVGCGEDRRRCFHSDLWSARVTATRTVQEAWASFLAYRDDLQAEWKPDQRVYLAMFRKLHAQHQLDSRASIATAQNKENIDYYGGDVEVLPVPHFLEEQTYVREPPPTMDELADQMHAQEVQPDTSCLAFLVAHAHSARDGLKCKSQLG